MRKSACIVSGIVVVVGCPQQARGPAVVAILSNDLLRICLSIAVGVEEEIWVERKIINNRHAYDISRISLDCLKEFGLDIFHLVKDTFREVSISIEVGGVDANVLGIHAVEGMALAASFDFQLKAVLVVAAGAGEKFIPAIEPSMVSVAGVFISAMNFGSKGSRG